MPSDHLQLIGLCRFSYPTAEGTGFSIKSGVNDIQRLKARLAIFKNLWVPSMHGQTDKRFSVIVLIGSGLPTEIREQLIRCISGSPQVHLHEEPDGQPHNEVCNRVLRKFRNPRASIVGEFGLDDDDAVSLDFVSEVHRYFVALNPIIRESGRAELDFSRGYAAQVDGTSCRLKEVVAPHWNCGQVIFQKMPSRLTMFNFHHYRFWKKHPCLLAAQRPMFIRSFHANNDSGNRWNTLKVEEGLVEPSEVSAMVRRRFGAALLPHSDGSLGFC